jgi:hypothetical protein
MADPEVFSNEEDPRVKLEVLEQVRKRLRELFGTMDHEVPLLLGDKQQLLRSGAFYYQGASRTLRPDLFSGV